MSDPSRPFSALAPGVLAGAVKGGVRYAFNFDNPDGVKLLSPAVFERLQLHASKGNGAQPEASSEADARMDQVLYEHGLLRRRGQYVSAARGLSKSLSLSIWLNVIDACNLGCFYCYIPELQKHIDPKPLGVDRFAMDETTAEVVAKKLIAYCSERHLKRLHVKFAGGEPTLVIERINAFCERLRLLADAAQVEISFNILTNGVFQLAAVLPVLRRWRMSVSISVDGMAANHDRIRYQRGSLRGRAGTWDAVMANARALVEEGIKPYFLYTVTPKTLVDVGEFSAIAHGLGCGFRLSLERAGKPVEHSIQVRTAEHLIEFYGRLAQAAPIDLKLDHAAKFAEWNLHQRKRVACSTCRGYVAIGRDGQVASCQMRLDEPVGHLQRDSLSESMERFALDPKTRKLRNPDEKSGGCTRCEFRFVCAGGCPQHTRDVWADVDRPSPWCFVYGSLAPKYIEACAVHLARRVDAASQPVRAA